MRICVLGNSHLTFCTAVAAARRGFVPVPFEEITSAELVIVAQDTHTDKDGGRLFFTVMHCLLNALCFKYRTPVVVQSQVPPGWCKRRLDAIIYHQPETLRIIDATDRAYSPERIVVGCMNPAEPLPAAYQRYLDAFNCPILKMTYEDAEFSKIATNMMLASQVDTTNRLATAAAKCGANWEKVAEALMHDDRIGSYLTPGRWQDSIHLLRDYVTLKEIEDARP